MSDSLSTPLPVTPVRQSLALAWVGGLLCAVVAAGAAVTLSPVFLGLAAAIVGLAGGILILRHPAVLLWILVLSAPLNEWLGLSIGGTTLRPYSGLTILGGTSIVWLFVSRQRNAICESVWFHRLPLAIAILLFLSKFMTVWLVTVFPPFMTRFFSIKLIALAGLQFSAAFVCASFIDSAKLLERVIRVWIHFSNLICFIAFIQLVISNTTHYEFVWHKEIFPLGRPYSVFHEPDVLGAFYATDLALFIPLLVGRVKFIDRTYLWLSTLIQTFFFLIIVVRAAWIALAVCLAMYGLLLAATGRFKFVLPYINGALLCAVPVLVGISILSPSLVEKLAARVGSFSNPKAEEGAAYRILELESMAQLVFHPTVGTGGGLSIAMGHGDYAWSYWAPELLGDDIDQSVKQLAPGTVLVVPGFCSLLSIVFDNGIVGLLLYAAFFAAVSAGMLKRLRAVRDPGWQALLVGTYLPVVALLVCYLFSYDPLFFVFYILLGFHLAAQYHASKAAAAESAASNLEARRVRLTPVLMRATHLGEASGG